MKVQSLGVKDPLEKGLPGGQPAPVFFAGVSNGQRSLVEYGPQGLKESMKRLSTAQ